MKKLLSILAVLALGASLSSCGMFSKKEDPVLEQYGIPAGLTGRLGVNGYLWRASLDTIAFMPLSSTDSTGGIIITDWYAPPDVPDERFKVAVYIMDLRLRADALRVAVFRQVMKEDGTWDDGAVKAGTARRLEDAILTRARQLRIQSIAGE